MHIILTGATGLVGSAVLNHMLTHSLPAGTISHLSILSRKPVPMADGHKNVRVIQTDNFLKYDSKVLEELQGAEGCVWALGVSQTEVGKEDLIKITKDMPLAAAKAFSGLHDPFKFIYVSGEGATLTPSRFTQRFGVVKGQTEKALLDLQKTTHPSLRIVNLRPGGVDARRDPAVYKLWIERQNSFKYTVMRNSLLPAVGVFAANMLSPTKELGKVLTDLATGDGEPLSGEGVEGEGRTVTNRGFRRMAGL